ncbi:MAG: 4Fe-4S binding protein [Spirochaetes bacterium]|jgi:ferredoxin|nr:4Fe-4S binding protein [Spirochaetota bacterium]
MKSKNILLIFNKNIMYKPIIFRLAKDFDVIFNVLEAKIFPKLEGRIILELRGSDDDIEKSIIYLKNEGVTIEVLADRIYRDDDRCVHCGACTSVCRVDALFIDRSTMEVNFYPEKCVACGLCKVACPVNAMSGASIDIES